MESDPDSLFTLLSFFVTPLLSVSPAGIYFALFLIILLLGCSALISSSEVAFFSLNVNDVKKLEQDNSVISNRILTLREQPRKLLATILISNNFINIGIIILSEFVLGEILSDAIRLEWARKVLSVLSLPAYFSAEIIAFWIHVLLAIVAVTFLLVLFGEVAPKVYAKLNKLKLARMMSRVLTLLMSFFTPLSTPLVRGTNFIERRLDNNNGSSTITSREEIDQAIELAVKEDETNTEQEIDILKSIVKFGDVSVKQIMCSRVDVVAIDFRMGFHEVIQLARKSGFSRIPVYDEDFDNIMGLLYVKDLLGHLEEANDFEWQPLIRTNVMYVPEAKKINDLLREFQLERLHMGIVVDEYGGSSGLVTLEDIMEEVIGEIKDEFDDDSELEYEKLDDHNYIFEGKTLLNDVCRIIGVDTETFDEVKGDADSVAGLLLEIVGQIPKANARVEYNDFNFKIVSVNRRRIERIHISLPETNNE
ncbi:MAG: gliding motility-associated protein GldE [Saprospiraceae bacterium]